MFAMCYHGTSTCSHRAVNIVIHEVEHQLQMEYRHSSAVSLMLKLQFLFRNFILVVVQSLSPLSRLPW